MASARELTILAAYAVRNCPEALPRDIRNAPDPLAHAFAMLSNANEASVRERYKNLVSDETEGFGEAPDRKALGEPLPSPIVMIKTCHHYAYQACEARTWAESAAKRVIDAIESHAIQHLPGYEEAPWGL